MTMHGRRQFLKAGSIAVGGMATLGYGETPEQRSRGSQVAALGWEAGKFSGNGANMHVEVLENMVLNSVNIDVSATILATIKAGFAEVLCTGAVSRQAVPAVDKSGRQAFPILPKSASFGSVAAQNPTNLDVNFNSHLVQDQFYSVILKTWVPADGTGSATSRQFLGYPALELNKGDYLVFHMDHAGVTMDAEMQIILVYSPR